MSLTLTIEMDFSINLLTNLASEKLECPLMKPHLTFEGHVVRRRRRKKASSGKKKLYDSQRRRRPSCASYPHCVCSTPLCQWKEVRASSWLVLLPATDRCQPCDRDKKLHKKYDAPGGFSHFMLWLVPACYCCDPGRCGDSTSPCQQKTASGKSEAKRYHTGWWN